MDTEVLRWYQQVADGYTVTEVADLAMVSQPGVSRALARLEREVGTPLLERSGRVLRTTHAGRVFKRHVDRVIHQVDDAVAAVSQLVDPETGTVSVAFQLSLGTWLIPRIVRSFHAQHPGVEFHLEQSRDDLGSSLVTGGQVNLELTARRPRNPTVHWERLFTEQLFLAVPPGHTHASSSPVRLADVSADDFIVLQPAWELRQLTERLCTDAGFTPHVVFEGDDLPTLMALVVAGLGVAILPAMDADPTAPRPGEAHLLPIADVDASRDIGLAWSTDRRLLPSATLFRDHVLADPTSWLTP